MVFKVDGQIVVMVGPWVDGGHVLHLGTVAQGGADPGKQLHGAKGLGDIVVGAKIKGMGLFVFVAAGGDHKNRGGCPLPKFLDDLHAVHVGKPQI